MALGSASGDLPTIHKCLDLPPRTIMMNTDIHTSAQAFGKVMSMIQPKHAIAYHFFDEEGTRYGIHDGIRETYDGPLPMATDMMV